MIRHTTLALLACMALSSAASAQAWPNRPVQIVVPAAAGSGPDVTLRIFTDRIAKNIGQSVVAVNRVGAAGAIGAQAAAKATPDGYTFFMASTGHLIVNKYTMKNPGYDPDKDFVPVAMLGRAPYMLLVNPALPIHSIADLGNYSRANPGKVFLAYEGSSVQALSAYVKHIMGFPIDLVAYNSPIQAIQDTMGGLVQLHVQGTAIGLAYVMDGKLRALAQLTQNSLPQLANVPTMTQLYPEFGSFEAWLAIMAPTGTPPDIISRLAAEIHKVGEMEEVRAIFNKLGFYYEKERSPEITAAYIRQQAEAFAKMAAVADLKPE